MKVALIDKKIKGALKFCECYTKGIYHNEDDCI